MKMTHEYMATNSEGEGNAFAREEGVEAGAGGAHVRLKIVESKAVTSVVATADYAS